MTRPKKSSPSVPTASPPSTCPNPIRRQPCSFLLSPLAKTVVQPNIASLKIGWGGFLKLAASMKLNPNYTPVPNGPMMKAYGFCGRYRPQKPYAFIIGPFGTGV